MTVWLTGCKGMLGQAFAQQFAGADIEFTGTDIEVDLTSQQAVEQFCQARRFTHIVNTAAYTRVDDAEVEVDKAFAVNGTAVRLLSEQAEHTGAALVHFSTDYVFAGNGSQPYTETAPVGPVSAYGKSKLDGERWALGPAAPAGGRYLVRTSWLFGPGGPNFVKAILTALTTRNEVRVVADQRGRPTYTRDLADVVMKLTGLHGGSPAPVGCYHYANGEAVSWYEFALRIAELARKKGLRLAAERIIAISSDELGRPAPRPQYSVLDTRKIESALGLVPRSYEAALDEYMDMLVPDMQAAASVG
jgi:dTDP-4-dehydrorhamnose reductase